MVISPDEMSAAVTTHRGAPRMVSILSLRSFVSAGFVGPKNGAVARGRAAIGAGHGSARVNRHQGHPVSVVSDREEHNTMRVENPRNHRNDVDVRWRLSRVVARDAGRAGASENPFSLTRVPTSTWQCVRHFHQRRIRCTLTRRVV